MRDRLIERWIASAQARHQRDVRRAYYLFMEYLLGLALGNALLNLDVEEPVRSLLSEAGLRLETLAELEQDPGLGNGGLGRLAAGSPPATRAWRGSSPRPWARAG